MVFLGQMFTTSATFGIKISLPDGIDNTANITFGAEPERLAVLFQGKLQWLGGPGPFKHSVEDLEEYLSSL